MSQEKSRVSALPGGDRQANKTPFIRAARDSAYQQVFGVFASYSFPLTTVNDRGGQMTATLCKRRVMKNYLRAYINYTQDNWVDHLPMAEFVASNHVNASTGVTPFFADYGFHPRTGIEPPQTYEGERRAELLAADKIVRRQEKMMNFPRI